MNAREIAHRMSEARRLLDEPLLNEALDAIEKHAIEELIGLAETDPVKGYVAARIKTHRVSVVRDFRHLLHTVIIGGEAALRPKRKVA